MILQRTLVECLAYFLIEIEGYEACKKLALKKSVDEMEGSFYHSPVFELPNPDGVPNIDGKTSPALIMRRLKCTREMAEEIYFKYMCEPPN